MICDINIKDNEYCSNEADFFGRWIAWCNHHAKEGKQQDWEHTYENEVQPDLESGNMEYIASDGQLQEMMLENL